VIGVMKAVVCRELGPPEALSVEEVERPTTGRGQVRIRVAACSINFPDLLIISGQYQERPELPFIPGQEVAGVVEEVGADVTEIEPGQAVMAATYQGGLAQYANANVQDVYKMPAGMPMEVAAGFPGVFGTSCHALKQRARLKPGETLLVLGAAGGVGLAAVQIGAAMGARVIAAARGEQKINFLRDNGADELIDYSTENLKDAVKDLTGGKGADVGGGCRRPALRRRARSWRAQRGAGAALGGSCRGRSREAPPGASPRRATPPRAGWATAARRRPRRGPAR